MMDSKKSPISSSPHDRYKTAVKIKSRIKRVLILGLFVSVLSTVGVTFIKSQLALDPYPITAVTEETTASPNYPSSIPISLNQQLEEGVDSSYDSEEVNSLSLTVKGIKKENELISFIIEGREPTKTLKLDLGNGIYRDVEGDTVFYKYKNAGRFMSYLLLENGTIEMKADSQYLEIMPQEINP